MRLFMRVEAVNAPGYSHTAERFAPRRGRGSIAGHRRETVRRFGSMADDTLDVFLNI